MINAIDYLNSKDIAAYWRKIGYAKKCSPLLTAYLIHTCNRITLAEKHTAWNTLISSMPDCNVATGFRKEFMGIPDELANSLHTFLQAYMLLSDELIRRFYIAESNAVFRYRFYCVEDTDWSESGMIYANAEDCFHSIQNDAYLSSEIAKIEITKQYIGEDKSITLSFKADKTILSIEATGLTESESAVLGVFEWLWFDCPMPFKRGDILVSKHTPFTQNFITDEPFVLVNMSRWGSKELKANGFPYKGKWREYNQEADKLLARYTEYGSDMDMCAYGYFQRDDGSVYFECMHGYLDLEYCREELKGLRRILKVFSAAEKEEISHDLVAEAYSLALQEEQLRQQKKRFRYEYGEWATRFGMK